jgi:DNA repair ATPase RecN
MRIASFSVENYKCFARTQTIDLADGLTVIVGPNDAGKTALMEALSLGFGARPHRSLATAPESGSPNPSPSVVRMTFSLERAELWEFLKIAQDLYLVLDSSTMAKGNRDTKVFREIVSDMQSRPSHQLEVIVQNGSISLARLNGYGPVTEPGHVDA